MKFIVGTCPRHCLTDHGISKHSKDLWDGLVFTASPTIHDTLKQAEAEALRFAELSPTGDTAFVVFQAISACHALHMPAVRKVTL